MRLVLVLAAISFAVMSSVASASTVSVADESPFPGPWASIVYEAGVGEVNHVELFTVDDRTLRVSDAGATILPGAGCTSIDAHSAVCSTAGRGLIAADVSVGDMDDVVNSHGPGLTANGGPGADRLESSSIAAGTLNGGGGRDVLLGGTNLDTLIDGDRSGAADADVMDGREGAAVVSYAGRTAPVRVDLADPGPDGETGEGDVLRSVDRVIGGSGDDDLHSAGAYDVLDGGPGNDRLRGGPGPGSFAGGPGRDRLSTGAGEDTLTGGAGRDLLLAGGGPDSLDGGPGPDRLHAGAGDDRLGGGVAFCGTGEDLVMPSKERDHLRPDCEEARFAMPPPRDADGKGIELEPYPYRRHRDSMRFRVICPYSELDGYTHGLPIRGRVTITHVSTGVVIARGRIPASAAPRCAGTQAEERLPRVHVRARFTARGRAVELPARVAVSYAGRNVPPVPWTIELSAGGR